MKMPSHSSTYLWIFPRMSASTQTSGQCGLLPSMGFMCGCPCLHLGDNEWSLWVIVLFSGPSSLWSGNNQGLGFFSSCSRHLGKQLGRQGVGFISLWHGLFQPKACFSTRKKCAYLQQMQSLLDRVSGHPRWFRTHYVAGNGLETLIFLPTPPGGWDYRLVWPVWSLDCIRWQGLHFYSTLPS